MTRRAVGPDGLLSAGPPRRRPVHPATPLLGLAVLAAAAISPLPVSIRVIAATIVVVMGLPAVCPGLWMRDSSADPSGGGSLARVLLLTTAPAAILTGAGLLGVPLETLLCIYLGALGAIGVFASVRRDARFAMPPAESAAVPAFLRLLPILVFAVVISALRGTPLGTTDDSFDHLASLRHVMETGRVEFPGAFFARQDVAGSDPRKGVMLTALALAGRLSNSDATEVWRWAGVILTPLALLAIAAVALVLFRRSLAGLAAASIMMLVWGDPLWLFRGAYGGHWGLVMAWAGLACLMTGAGFMVGLMAGAVCASVHAFSPAQLMTPLVLALLVGSVRSEIRLSGVIGVLAGAAPVEIVRFLAGQGPGNPLHEQAMGWLMLPAGPIASPLQLLAWYGFPGITAGCLLLILAPWIRDRAGAFLVSSFLAPLLLLLNPFLFGPVATILGSVANKVALVWIHPLATLWILYRAAAAKGPVRMIARAGAVLLFLQVLLSIPGRAEVWFGRQAELPVEFRASVDLVAAHTPADAVVASDPLTSYGIPALTGRRAIVSLHQHAPPGDTRALERLAVTSSLYSTCVPLDAALRRVSREGAEFLLFAAFPSTRLDQYGLHLDPRNRDVLKARFESRPDLLESMATAGEATLYRIRPQAGDGELTAAWTMDQAIDTGVPGGALSVSDGVLDLAIAPALPESCRRGDRLVLPIAWRKNRDPAPYFEYFGHLRFENQDAATSGFGPTLISKPLRRIILEPRLGGSLRWRTVEMPFRGLCGPVEWPAGRWLGDSMEVIVPPRLVPGRYRILMSVERGTLYPRLSPADLLSDEDRFSGPVLGSLWIQ